MIVCFLALMLFLESELAVRIEDGIIIIFIKGKVS